MGGIHRSFSVVILLLIWLGCFAVAAVAAPAPQAGNATSAAKLQAAAAGTPAVAAPKAPTDAQSAASAHRKLRIRSQQSGDMLIVPDFDVSGEGDFDKQRIDGASPPLQIGLLNTSTTATVAFTGVTATAPFTATTDCTSLAPGQTCHVFVTYAVTTVCAYAQTDVTVTDNDPGGNLVMSVEGFGADTAIQVDDLTDSKLSATALAQALVGAGVQISNVTYTGAARAAGQFTSTSNILGFTSGIVLSTGSVRNVPGPNCIDGISVDNGEPGDADLNTIVGAGNTTNDAAVLEFDFVPTSSTISFQYVFASEEYNDFVFEFNDVFGFFLTDNATGAKMNIALIPGTNLPVSINNVNDGNPVGTNPVNPQFYINNEFIYPTVAPLDTEMNGLTTVFTAQATVTPNNSYHIKLAVADANDFALDSNVFVQAGSLTSSTITLTPGTLAFGNQAMGTTSPSQPILITNVGTQPLTINSIVASANFGETDNCPATLTAAETDGSSCTANVTFVPTATGLLDGTLTVTYASGTTTGQTQVATLTGTGTAATGPTLTIAPTSLTFTSQAVGTTSAPQTVMVSNPGTTLITFTAIATSGDFSGATLAQCPSLAGGASCSFAIVFTPTATGARTGAITFTDNATGSPQMVTLAGTGVAKTSTVTVAPPNLTFGPQPLNTTSPALPVTVTNTGNSVVDFTSFTATGDFAVTNAGTCSTDGGIGVGGSCTVTVAFTPTATGARTGTLAIADSATGSPQMVTLAGTGGTGNITLTVAEAGTGSGTVTSAPAGINCPTTCAAGFASGTSVTLTAAPATGSTFAGWSGGGCSGTGTCVVTITAATTVTATFNLSNQSVVITVPSGGSTSATTTPGGTAYYGLLITGAPGTSGTVTLTCVSSSPFVTCKVVHSTVVLNGTSTTEVAFGIQTYCTGPTNTNNGSAPAGFGGFGGGISLMLMGMLGVVTFRFKRDRRLALTFAMLMLMAFGSAACSSLPTNANGATPAGTYTISLTTTLNGSSQTLPNFLTLVVK